MGQSCDGGGNKIVTGLNTAREDGSAAAVLDGYKSMSTAVPAAFIDLWTFTVTGRSPEKEAWCAADGTRNISAPVGQKFRSPCGRARMEQVSTGHLHLIVRAPQRSKNRRGRKPSPIFGAADGTRTRTVSLPGDFKSPVSTDSTTAAAGVYDSTFLFYRQGCFRPAAGGKTPPRGEKSFDFLLFRGQTEGPVL